VYTDKPMSSIPSEPAAAEISNSRKSGLRRVANSHWTFIALQGLDLLTTMVAFRLGASEVNPLVAHLTVAFGRFRGVLISKLIAIGIAMGVRTRLWMINIFYAVIILWNSANLLSALLK
jgi:uncharacterized membrane protein